MKRVGLFISVFFLFLIGVLFIPSFRSSAYAACYIDRYGDCKGTCTGGSCYSASEGSCTCKLNPTATTAPYCSTYLTANCLCGCIASSSGGTCRVCPTNTPVPCTSYCSGTCLNGCYYTSCTGGACKPYCSYTLQVNCTYGCTATTSGGTCNSAPTATNTPTRTPTPAPKYTCNNNTGYCYETTSGYATYSSCQSLCVKNTPTPTTQIKCSSLNRDSCSAANNCGNSVCVPILFGCYCAIPTATSAPTPTINPNIICGVGLGGSGTCSSYSCANGGTCQAFYGYCACVGPSNTPTNTPTKTPTPTAVPCKTSGGTCTTSTDCCSGGLCIRGICAAPTSTPVPNCTSKGGICIYSNCSYYSSTYCAVAGGTCNYGYACCATCPTNTPQPTSPPPTGIITPGVSSCTDIGQYTCQSNTSYVCTAYGTRKYWDFYQTCFYDYPDGSGVTCNEDTGKCFPDSGIYCTTLQAGSSNCVTCGINKYTDYCYESYESYLSKDPNLLSSTCVTTSVCGCTILHDTCGGDAMACTGGEVSHIDNCHNVFCGPPCATPTPGGTGGSCTADCSCASSICAGSGTCSDGCGGTCYGTAVCTGTINAKAVLVDPSDRSCTALASAPTLDGTILFIDGSSQTQTTGATLTWTNMASGLYTISGSPPGQYATGNTCVSQNSGAYIQGTSGTLLTNGTLNFLVGYIPQSGWVQTIGGNVYAGNQLVSSIPTSATNPYFSLAGAMGDAGMVTYGTSYDFSLISTDLGENNVSTKRWLMQHTNSSVDYYTQFVTRMDIPGSATAIENRTNVTKPTCATSPCILYADGDMTTAVSAPWSIGATEQMIVFVNGNVTINSPITITSGGFFALISHNGIYVNSTVGGTTGSVTPTLEGIYIATNENHTAIFATGDSNTVGSERLVVRGSVIADTFQLFRDLGTTINNTTPAEQFIFNPQLLFTMPDVMKEIPYVWQEVAP